MTVGANQAGATRSVQWILVVALLVGMAGCSPVDGPASILPSSVLRIGFGLTTGAGAQAGIRQAAMNISLEGLIAFGPDGRPRAWLADRWTTSPDGLSLRIRLRPDVTFHDGSSVTSEEVAGILRERLRDYVGPAFEDIKEIRAASPSELELVLNRRSNFILEGLDVLIQRKGAANVVGTGPYAVEPAATGNVTMAANDRYYLGTPIVERIELRPYASVRSAWADLLRQEVDMLYEVGVDAINFLQPSTDVSVFTFPRPYASLVILNVTQPQLRDAKVRRGLNLAINRQEIVDNALNGHGTPANGPVWPHHWAYRDTDPTFSFEPEVVAKRGNEIPFRLLYTEPSHERIALVIQRQLQAVGVNVILENAPLDQALARAVEGDFDGFLADAVQGPTMVRPSLFWHSRAPINWARYKSPAVDQALDMIRHAPDDDAYRAGVAAFQKAFLEDPPAIFLAWGERARAVSARFAIPPVEPGVDILPTLRLWKPAADNRAASPN